MSSAWAELWRKAAVQQQSISEQMKNQEKIKNDERKKQKNEKNNNKKEIKMNTCVTTKSKNRRVRFLAQTNMEGTNIEEEDAEAFGDVMNAKNGRVVRIVFQNIGMLTECKETSKSRAIVNFFEQNDIDVMLMAEIGLRWDKVPIEDQWSERIYGSSEKEKHIMTYNKHDGQSTSAIQYGGTGISVRGELTHRVIESGADESGMGRWCWILFQGKNNQKLRIISAYRPCAPSGPMSVGRQHQRVLQAQGCFVDVREKMLEDLKEQCLKWEENGDILVVGMDVNEDVRSERIAKFADDVGLVNAVLTRHRGKSPPATYNRNESRQPIDGIWTSARVQYEANGFLAFDCGVPSDHRGIWIDIPYEEALGYSYPPLGCKGNRKLKANDPRLVSKYCKNLTQELNKEGLPSQLCKLEDDANELGWSDALENKFNALHKRINEIRMRTEKSLKKTRSGAVPWSPKLQSFRDRIELWSMVKKKQSNIKTSTKKIKRLARKTRIFNAMDCSRDEASKNLDDAFANYKKAKSKAGMWRNDFLHNLAHAIAEKKGTKTEKEAKALQHIQRQKNQALSIKRMRKKLQDLSVHKIQVGEAGEIETVDEKSAVERAFIRANLEKFSQSQYTPPCTEPLKSILGEFGETEEAMKILDGSFESPDDLSDICKEFIKELQMPEAIKTMSKENHGISTEVHVQGWKRQKERTSAEPTGPSFSHYKAACDDELLATVDAILRSLPYQYGFSPDEWKKITDVQILKKAGIFHVEKMRTIMLMHSEFNINNKLVGKVMMDRAKNYRLLAPEQYGSRKRHQAIAAALNKKITFDILRQKRLAGAICSNDAKSCYDRIVHNIACLCMVRLGAPKEAVLGMFKTLKKSTHFIKTAFGISTASYKASNEHNLQGIGQGNGCGPAAWAAISTPLINIMRKRGHGLKFTSALSQSVTEFVAYAFVDDTDLITTARDVMENAIITMDRLQSFMTDWDDMLYLTGGAVVPEKSFWTMISFVWRNDGWRYQKIEEVPGELRMKDPRTRELKEIYRAEPHEAKETLGVFLAGDGNNNEQIKHLRSKSQTYAQCLKAGMISKYDVNHAIRTTIWKTLEYPLLVTDISREKWNYIMSPSVRASLPRMGFVRTLPNAFVYGTITKGGVGIKNLWHYQFLKQITYFIDESLRESIDKHLMITSLEQLILETGLGKDTKQWPMQKVTKYVSKGWWSSLLEYLSTYNFQLHHRLKGPEPVSDDDRTIMGEILKHDWPASDLKIINECRMTLRAMFVSDIVHADGRTVWDWALDGMGSATTGNWQWPRTGRLTRRHWRKWHNAIVRALLNPGSIWKTLRRPIGRASIKVWDTQGGKYWCYSPLTKKLFYGNSGEWESFVHVSGGRTLRRRRFVRSPGNVNGLPDDCCLATVAPFDAEPHRLMIDYGDPITWPVMGNVDVSWEAQVQAEREKNVSVWESLEGADQREAIAQSITRRQALAVSDGSYFDGYGTSASVLSDREGSEMWGRSITPGYAKYQSPHRSELAGVICSITLIKVICEYFNITSGLVTVCLDGEQAIKNILRDEVRTHHADYDMLLQVRELVSKIPIDIEWEWVRGHQDNTIDIKHLPLEAQLNVKADKKAKDFLHATMNTTIPVASFTFPTEDFWVTLDSKKITRFQLDKMYELVTKEDSFRAWAKSSGNSLELVRSWDWEGFGLAMEKATFAEKRRITKLSSGFAPVGHMMHKWQKQDHSRCPCCAHEDETVSHMIICPAAKMTFAWNTALTEYRVQLERLDTSPDILQEILRQLRYWRINHNGSPLPSRASNSWQLDRAVTHQNEIGWNNFLFGRISPVWGRYQQKYFNQIQSLMTGTTWARRLISLTWKVLFHLWDTRNDVKHNDLTQARLEEIEALQTQIEDEYSLGIQHLHPNDQHFLDLPLEDILTLPWDHRVRWLSTLQAARQKYNNDQQNTHNSMNHLRRRMREWLTSNSSQPVTPN